MCRSGSAAFTQTRLLSELLFGHVCGRALFAQDGECFERHRVCSVFRNACSRSDRASFARLCATPPCLLRRPPGMRPRSGKAGKGKGASPSKKFEVGKALRQHGLPRLPRLSGQIPRQSFDLGDGPVLAAMRSCGQATALCQPGSAGKPTHCSTVHC